VTQGSVCGIWMRRFITVGVVVAVGLAVVESMTRGLFASGRSALVSVSTAPNHDGVTAGPGEQVRRDDDGYVEGLATTLGYQSPELMATGSIGPDHAVAQR
jgi:hypothetical protein